MIVSEIVTGIESSRSAVSILDSLLIFLGAMTGSSIVDKKFKNEAPPPRRGRGRNREEEEEEYPEAQ